MENKIADQNAILDRMNKIVAIGRRCCFLEQHIYHGQYGDVDHAEMINGIATLFVKVDETEEVIPIKHGDIIVIIPKTGKLLENEERVIEQMKINQPGAYAEWLNQKSNVN